MPARGGWVAAGRLFVALGMAGTLLVGISTARGADDEPFDPEFDDNAVLPAGAEDLRFIADAPDRLVHNHLNTVEISAQSLATGWVGLRQCHRNLDQVERLQILFRAERIRDLRIIDYERIDKAWVDGPSVQLEGVGAGAELCLSAESLALRDHGDGTYVLRNGPFMRRFLDGYFPMRVFFSVVYPVDALQFFAVEPKPQMGFRVWQGPGRVGYEALFEGQLTTELFLTRP